MLINVYLSYVLLLSISFIYESYFKKEQYFCRWLVLDKISD